MLWPPLLSAPLPLPGPRRGERTGLGSGLRLHDCVQCEEMVHLLIKMLRMWTRRSRGGHHHPGCGSGLSKRHWRTGFPLGSRVPRASGRACALHGVFRGEGLAWILSTCTCLGMSSCPSLLSVGMCVWPPSHLPALCWGHLLRDARKSPTCVNAVFMQTQREAGTVRVQFPRPWCRLRGPTVCFKHNLVELQLACRNSKARVPWLHVFPVLSRPHPHHVVAELHPPERQPVPRSGHSPPPVQAPLSYCLSGFPCSGPCMERSPDGLSGSGQRGCPRFSRVAANARKSLPFTARLLQRLEVPLFIHSLATWILAHFDLGIMLLGTFVCCVDTFSLLVGV